MEREKATTRKFSLQGIDEDGCEIFGDERPAIDDALMMLAHHAGKQSSYTGSIKTAWKCGGMREPQISGWNKSWMGQELKKLLPENYTGKATWHLNNGELSGKPRLH